MEQITTSEMLAHFPAVLSKIAAGEHLLITEEKSGQAVAELCPPSISLAPSQNFKEAFLQFHRNNKIDVTLDELIAWKNEGRK